MAWSIFSDGGGTAVAVGWAHQFLRAIGAPESPGNLEFVYQWEKSEGGGGKFNPLNQGPVQGKPYLTTTGEQFGGGAADFASWDAGLQGAYDFLHYRNYAGVLQGLINNNPVAARQALWSSPWAAGHYGYGADWAFVALPGNVTPVLPTGGGITPAGGAGHSVGPTCALPITIPGVGEYCVASKVGVRGIFATGLMGGALLVGLVGVALLVVYGFKETRAGRTVERSVRAVPGGAKILR